MNGVSPEVPVAPPRGLRSVVLAAALDRRPAGYPDPDALPTAAGPYGAEVGKLDSLMRELTADQWGATVSGELTVQQLVEHLTAYDAALASWLLRLAVPGSQAWDDAPHPAHRRWREQAFALLRHAVSVPLDGLVELEGLRMATSSAYLFRAFETWIHADDIRLAMGQPAIPPAPSHLHQLADLHVCALSTALTLSGRAHPGRAARVVLTGDGGGEWIIPLAMRDQAAVPDLTLTAEALPFCRLAASRGSLDAMPYTVIGDRQLADDLLAVLAYFSHE